MKLFFVKRLSIRISLSTNISGDGFVGTKYIPETRIIKYHLGKVLEVKVRG